MKLRKIALALFAIVISCKLNTNETYPDIHITGAMKNVMWKGELSGTINLDTISDIKGLYGLGPQSYLIGELLINNGKSYVSKVTSDSTMIVERHMLFQHPFLYILMLKNGKNFTYQPV